MTSPLDLLFHSLLNQTPKNPHHLPVCTWHQAYVSYAAGYQIPSPFVCFQAKPTSFVFRHHLSRHISPSFSLSYCVFLLEPLQCFEPYCSHLVGQSFDRVSFCRLFLAVQAQATAFTVFGLFSATTLFAVATCWERILWVFHLPTQL